MKQLSFPRSTLPALWRRYRLLWLPLLCGVLLLALAAVIWVDNTLNRGIDYTPDPTPIPWTDGTQVGVNVYNLHMEPDPMVVRRTLELVRDLGARYVRMQMPWEDVEIHGRSDFEDRRHADTIGVVSAWDKYDRIVNTASELGLELILRLDRPPAWARQGGSAAPFFQEGLLDDPTSTGPPDDFADYGHFVEKVVERYRDKVRFFQLWNEPNLKTEWGWHTPSPASFMVLLRAGYMAGHAANPNAVFIFPSLAPSDGLDQRAPMTELEYLDGVYQAGGAQFFDVMSVQAYGLGQPPDEHRYVRLMPLTDWRTWWRRPLDTRTDVSRVVLLREVMERNGDSHKPIWIGEFGWNSAPESIPEWRRTTWGNPVSEQQKAEYILGFIERAREEWPWMGVMNIWNLRHGGYQEPDAEDPTPYFSLVQRDWTPLPAYTQLQAYLSQPDVAGLGAHTWQHPAVEHIPSGWRLRFSGQQVTLVGRINADARIILDGAEVAPTHSSIDRQPVVTIRVPEPGSAPHTLEIRTPGAKAPESFVIARDPPVPLWVWTLLPMLIIGLLVVSGATLMPDLFHLTHRALAHSPPGRLGVRVWLRTSGGEWALLIGMLVGLLIFYGFTNDLLTRLVGMAIFGLLACIRPDLALLFVLVTVPLFFMPKGIWDDRFSLPAEGVRFPLHEVALLLVTGATGLRWLAGFGGRGSEVMRLLAGSWRHVLESGFSMLRIWFPIAAPAMLFLLAGTIGVLIAPPEGRGAALREWRWLIVEPLLFYGLLYFCVSRWSGGRGQQFVINAWLAGGALVGLLGMLQFCGLNLVPLLGTKVTFSDDRIFVEGVQRVSSVYGHPNNLGLYMGRLWPVALVLALATVKRTEGREQRTENRGQRAGQLRRLGFYAGCLLLTAGGLVVSFSKGALLGAVGAVVVLAVQIGRDIGFLWPADAKRPWRVHPVGAQRAAPLPDAPANQKGYATPVLLGGRGVGTGWKPGAVRALPRQRFVILLAGVSVAGMALALAVGVMAGIDIARLNPFGESSGIRLKLWASSLAMLWDHLVLGIGLDQFLGLYPRYIDPSLIGTNELFTSHPHNLILDIWLRLGIVGVLTFGWLLGRFYRNVLLGHPRTLLRCGLAAAMTAALVHGLADNFYFVPDLAFTFWLLVWAGERVRLCDHCIEKVPVTPVSIGGMNITGATGLTDAQRETLRALGAVEDGQ